MTAKTIKRLAILITVLGLITGAMIGVQRYQLTEMAASVLAQAKLAEKTGKLSEAESLYQQHLEVVPDDTETKLQYADLLGKSDHPLKQQEAIGLYSDVLKRHGALTDVRRKRMDLHYKRRDFRAARSDLAILLPTDKDDPELLRTRADGDLLFKMGWCCEVEADDGKAATYYRAAIKTPAPERLAAYQRLAILLRKKPGQEKEADRLIEEMVNSDPGNYQVYLERGRYRDLQAQAEAEPRRSQIVATAHKDFQKARELAPGVPEVVLELAKAAPTGKSGRSQVRQILENGLNTEPKSVELYLALAGTELADGQADKAIAVLERGLMAQPESLQLHWRLAEILAQRGDAGKLLVQIEELKRLGFPVRYINYFMAYYHAILHQYQKARQLLVQLVAEGQLDPTLALQVNLLLATCYGQLGEPQMQKEAYGRARRANSGHLGARLGYINTQIQQGDLDGAIEGYRELRERVPEVGTELAKLLITRNRVRPAPERNWEEVEGLIDKAAKAAPASATPVVLRAELLLARDPTKIAEARELIREARKGSPKSVELWNAEAQISGELWEAQANPASRQQKIDEALALLDEAERQVGDRVEFRLQRAQLLTAKMGPQVVPALLELAQNVNSFSKGDRRKLLDGLAVALVRQKNFEGASRLWSQLAEDDPSDIGLRLKLLDLAFQTRNKGEIEKNIAQIGQIEGDEGVQSRYWHVRYLIWQIQAADSNPKIRQELRTQARAALSELRLRRPEWSVVPRMLAALDEQELEQGGLDEKEKREKLDRIVNSCIEAINLGQRDSTIIDPVVNLLFAQGRANEALALFNRIPQDSRLASDLGLKVVQAALGHRNFDLAEQAIEEAQKHLPAATAPLALAQCCELIARAYEAANNEPAKVKWYGKAEEWYVKDQTAQLNDLPATRRLTDFFIRTKQLEKASSLLNGILESGNAKNSDMTVWARRTLALTLASGTDSKRLKKALSLVEPQDQGNRSSAKAIEDPEDIRVLAQVLESQGTPEHRARAVKLLQSLVAKSLANADDRYRLARLMETGGDWPGARGVYRELIARTENARDLETLSRRPIYMFQFTNSLLRHHRAGDGQNLTEVEEMIGKLKKLQPNTLEVLALELERYRLQNQFDKVDELLESFANRTDLTVGAREKLAEMAEVLGRFELAEKLHRGIVDRWPDLRQKKMALIAFLGRRGRVKDALDLCEPLWKGAQEPEVVARLSFEALFGTGGSKNPKSKDLAQLSRVADWLEQAVAKNPKSTALLVGLANLREQQQRYADAEELYQRAIANGDSGGVSHNNLAWLMALKDHNGPAALDYINKAIGLKGRLPDFLDTRGVIYLTAGDKQRAIKDLEDAVAGDPAPDKLFHLAQAYLQVHDNEKAKQNLEKAKSKGLVPSKLHPLEAPAYDKMVTELGMK